MASLMGIGILATRIAPKAIILKQVSSSLFNAVISPAKDFFQRYGLKTALLFFFTHSYLQGG
jgi:hypothetical protein